MTSIDSRAEAIEALEEFGLSAYAARTFVALTGLGSGTAKDVAEVSDVPRTRVYDAVEELSDMGLVDVQHASPKEFWPISADTTGRKFDREFRQRSAALTGALSEMEPIDRREEQEGVWTVTGETSVTDRVVEFFDGAEEEIVYMTVESLLTDDLLERLRDAADRGVSVRLAGSSPAVQERIQETVPGAEVFESLWVWSDTPAGRLMMVDDERTLISVVTEGPEERRGGSPYETAIWGSGEYNSLVVVLRAVFTWRLDDWGVR